MMTDLIRPRLRTAPNARPTSPSHTSDHKSHDLAVLLHLSLVVLRARLLRDLVDCDGLDAVAIAARSKSRSGAVSYYVHAC